MTVLWKLNRLGTMDAREVAYRCVEMSRAVIQKAGFGRARPSGPSAATGRPWLPSLPTEFETLDYRNAADAVLRGVFRIFDTELPGIGFPPRWDCDPKTGVRAPLVYGKLLDYRDESLVGNIKYLWELNRHLELVTVAQAWHLTGDEKYVHGLRVLMESWIEQCPYPLGPSWSSSLELAIRLVNWSFAWHLMGGEEGPLFKDASGAAFKARWLESIFQHCHFIASFPSLYSSANNHRLGEALGLFVAATTWPKWRECDAWRESAHNALNREALLQNTSDGVNREQATWYHHEVADMLLIAGLVGRANSVEFSKSYWQRLEAMLDFIASIMDVSGNVPSIGDSDDAVMVRFCPKRDFPVFRSLLATGAVIFNRGDLKAKACEFDDKSRWLLGDAAALRFREISAEMVGLPCRNAMLDGGYAILGSDFEKPSEVRIVADVGPLGYLSIAAHGHADALSFTLSVSGTEVLIDSGTFAYHTDKVWRDYFRGTSAHNTVRVDGIDQSVPGGNFMWKRHADVVCEECDINGDRQILASSHNGYCRLRDPVLHRRKLIFDRASRVLLVEDGIEAGGEHLIEMFWHLHELAHVDLFEAFAEIRRGAARVRISWPQSAKCRMARGEVAPPLGWVSRRFDSKMPCFTLVVTQPIVGNWRGMSKVEVLEP